MCGIAGIILRPNASLPELRERLATMTRAMIHRGPDDEGVYLSPGGQAGLGNRRLAIRDLSPAGHMPMGNDDGLVWITYNGEVYNAGELQAELETLGYHFRSCSDTEVVLRGYEAWGAEVVERLRGMFALAILDRRPAAGAGRLFLARDRLGIKPLYYAHTGQALLFASEIKALLASGLVGREISPEGLAGYLLLGSVPNPWTIYQGVRALPPGARLMVPLDRVDEAMPEVYWHLPAGEDGEIGAAEAVAQVRDLLAEAVRVRLVSDVPLGGFLSGGLDSSSVVALMRRASNGPIRTCSMVFQEAEYSEATYARAVADRLGTDHYERVVTAADLERELPTILAALDQPSIDGVNTYFVSQTARQAGLTVALSGLGGDELFGGYPNTFRGVPMLWGALRLAHALPGGPALAGMALDRLPGRQRWSRVRAALDRPPSPASAYLAIRGLLAPAEVQALLRPDLWQAASAALPQVLPSVAQGAPGAPWPWPAGLGPGPNWVSRAELRHYTHNQLLRDTDVMSMIHSLEVRVPLLDHRLVEAVLRLPPFTQYAHYYDTPKPLLRQAVAGDLPRLVLDRRDKRGFTFPFSPWLRGPLRATMLATLDAVEARGWLQPGAARQLYDDYCAGRRHWSRPWALAALAAVA